MSAASDGAQRLIDTYEKAKTNFFDQMVDL